MKHREVIDLATKAARHAADQAVAAGYGRNSKVAKDSAFAAAKQIIDQHLPEPDPRDERMNREPNRD